MKNKTRIKLGLDIVLLILLLLLYNKMVISLNFHEIVGVVLAGLFLIHIILNWRWVVRVSKGIFSKEIINKVKFGYLINVLLFITVSFICISGIMISKTIFISISSHSNFWKVGHFFSSAIALILIGIHLGLHWQWLKGKFRMQSFFFNKIVQFIALFCVIFVIVLGGYNTVTSDFSKWLAAPLQISMKAPIENRGEYGSDDKRILKENNKKSFNGQQEQHQYGRPGSETGQLTFKQNTSIFHVLTTYGSIVFLFAIVSYWISKKIWPI